MVPEPTEAMVEAAARSFHEWGDWSKGIVAAFAAAPPEWIREVLEAKTGYTWVKA